jgi:hypothetical protein
MLASYSTAKLIHLSRLASAGEIQRIDLPAEFPATCHPKLLWRGGYVRIASCSFHQTNVYFYRANARMILEIAS